MVLVNRYKWEYYQRIRIGYRFSIIIWKCVFFLQFLREKMFLAKFAFLRFWREKTFSHFRRENVFLRFGGKIRFYVFGGKKRFPVLTESMFCGFDGKFCFCGLDRKESVFVRFWWKMCFCDFGGKMYFWFRKENVFLWFCHLSCVTKWY